MQDQEFESRNNLNDGHGVRAALVVGNGSEPAVYRTESALLVLARPLIRRSRSTCFRRAQVFSRIDV